MLPSNPSPQPVSPFSLRYTPNLPELLMQMRVSLAISTYQAGKVVFISPRDEEQLVQLPRTFHKAMGIGLHGDRMAVATRDEVITLRNSPGLAAHYPRQPNTYDALFMPRASFFTGNIDIHDLDFGTDGLYAVNTSFSCLIKVDDTYSFTPVWRPPFITELVSEDRCHLNGMAMENGKPRYVTAFNQGNSHQSWRPTVTESGILMDVTTNEVVLDGLPMPHSPRLYADGLYLLLSATGELVKVDVERGTYDVVHRVKGFVRGLARYGDYVFIGLSRLRRNSSTFAKLNIEGANDFAGIAVVHLPTGAYVGDLRYLASVDEIYDVQVLPGMLRPGILNTDREEYKMGLHIPSSTYWARPGQADSK